MPRRPVASAPRSWEPVRQCWGTAWHRALEIAQNVTQLAHKIGRPDREKKQDGAIKILLEP